MKTGIVGNLRDPYNTYPYWVLPDRHMVNLFDKCQEVNRDATDLQNIQIQSYLKNACAGQWCFSNDRFFFSLEPDWESFKIMCTIGWQ